MSYWYVSFARPAAWLGAVVTTGERGEDAIAKAKQLHPTAAASADQVVAFPVPEEHTPPVKYLERPLTKEEVSEMDGEPALSLGEHIEHDSDSADIARSLTGEET